MKDVKALEEHVQLLEKEISTLADDMEKVTARCQEYDETRNELLAVLMFLERRYPELKTELPELIGKLKTC